MTRTWSLEALGLAGDPAAKPLSYPGALPHEHGLLVDGSYLPLIPSLHQDVGCWLVEAGDSGVELLSVGSNAAPAQLLRKFERQGVKALVPMTKARVTRIVPGMSAHVSRYGYVPATCVMTPDEQVELFVAWLDEDELKALDATEPNYDRVLLPSAHFPVVLPSDQGLDACSAYISKWGCLTDPDGQLWTLVSQHELLTRLLAGSRALQELFGDTPESFVKQAVADPFKRKQAQRIFQDEGWVRPQPELEQFRGASSAELPYTWSGSHRR
jgi:hypothetical protein